ASWVLQCRPATGIKPLRISAKASAWLVCRSEIRCISGLALGEFRIRKHTSNSLNLVWFGFEVPKHGCHRNDGNFKSTTLAVAGERVEDMQAEPRTPLAAPIMRGVHHLALCTD